MLISKPNKVKCSHVYSKIYLKSYQIVQNCLRPEQLPPQPVSSVCYLIPLPHPTATYYGELALLQEKPLHINYLLIPSLKTNTIQKSILVCYKSILKYCTDMYHSQYTVHTIFNSNKVSFGKQNYKLICCILLLSYILLF